MINNIVERQKSWIMQSEESRRQEEVQTPVPEVLELGHSNYRLFVPCLGGALF